MADMEHPNHTQKDAREGTAEFKLPFDNKWLEAFYHECGREITLAFTTLNQVKNWAMLIAAAAISGLAFGSSAQEFPSIPMLMGIVVVYVFTLRFFIRAILSYINLLRWNTLQSDCQQLMLIPREGRDGQVKSKAELANQLKKDIQDYYYQWLSPCDRKTQLLSNLKLGFALLFALPLFFMLWGIATLWEYPLTKGLAFFALGDTVVEFNDFSKSSFFDDLHAHKRKRTHSKFFEIFPVPASRGWFIGSWLTVLLLSVAITTWPSICSWLTRLINAVR